MTATTRVTFIVDGFNLYHSLREASRAGRFVKWLDLRGFCRSYLPSFGRTAVVENVYYYSAYATHLTQRKADVLIRHQTYVSALRNSGVIVELSRFKRKRIYCASCQQQTIRYEEKETDVAIAARLLELLVRDACDIAVLVSGDTDLAPAVRTAKKLFPDKQIWMMFPYRRFNAELQQIADSVIRIRPQRYARHQFPATVQIGSGRSLHKPKSW